MDDHRTLSIGPIYVQGVQDRDIPDEVVRQIQAKIGRDYQQRAAYQGNNRIGR
jgi:hypothetical protein